eukprot:TRINITY_DN63_c3_g1_i1.p1 TRINITY_DN63_c3_g1~~TRINITY_DN63_c3_g1_i1.p1  ORF type:complete len:299 (+),score=53.59 TRINITY_DN63_c3_g1_i1:25-921(+)
MALSLALTLFATTIGGQYDAGPPGKPQAHVVGSLYCETCQQIVYMLHNNITKHYIGGDTSYSRIKRVEYIQRVMDTEDLCYKSEWRENSEKSKLDLNEMVEVCSQMVNDFEEELEEYLINSMPEEEIRSKICLKQLPQGSACPKLWGKNEMPTKRFTQHQTNEIMNKAMGNMILEENAEKDGVISLKNGVQYRIIEEGDSSKPRPKQADEVKMSYIGYLLNGKKLEEKNEVTMSLTSPDMLIGWRQVLKRMYPGSTYETHIPYRYAYGAEGTEDVGPYESLRYRITLHEVLSEGNDSE